MPSSCPKCRRVLEEDEICCAQVRYTWRCKSCFKLTSGFAIPYGKCFLCGGELEVMPGRELGDSMRFQAIRDAVQFELNSFHFYKLARDTARLRRSSGRCWSGCTRPSSTTCTSWKRSTTPTWTAKWWSFPRTRRQLLANWLFRGIRVTAESGIADLYQAALEMERRTRDHFQKLAHEPAGGAGKGPVPGAGGGRRGARGAARRGAGAGRVGERTVGWTGPGSECGPAESGAPAKGRKELARTAGSIRFLKRPLPHGRGSDQSRERKRAVAITWSGALAGAGFVEAHVEEHAHHVSRVSLKGGMPR